MSHQFTVEVTSKQELRGEATPRDVSVTVPFCVPKEFGGPGGDWTPEHFFAAAINACVTATFLSIAKQSRLSLASYDSAATVYMEKTGQGLRMTRVELRPRIRVSSEEHLQSAERMIRKAESLCPISNSVTSEVVLEPRVEASG